MTPFAQLGSRDELTKDATTRAFLSGAHNLMRNGFWKTVARKTTPGAPGWRGGLNRVSRAFHNPDVGEIGADGFRAGKSTMLSKGLTAYGFGGLGASAFGYNVPGSDLALNATMPGMGALFSAPGLISTARLARQGNQDRIMEDAKMGAREAIGDMMSLAQTDPRYASHADLYRQFMSKYSPDSAALSSRYSSGDVKPLSAWGTLSAAFSDPQAIVNNQIDQRIPGLLSKAGGLEKVGMTALRAVGRGAGHVFPWLFPTMGVGAVGHALLRDKPYDATQVQQRGYAGTQAAMQNKLQTLSLPERMALRLDPTLIGQQAEKLLPGTISQWEQRTGQKHQPGFLSGLVDNWTKGGDNAYYEYDAAGTRKYI